MASRHPKFVERMLRRHTIQPPTLLALGRSPARQASPLLSPTTPLARRVWEDLLARYATEMGGAENISAALAANRELLSSLSLLGMLTQRTRHASRARAGASTSAAQNVPAVQTMPALSAGLPYADAALPGLSSVAAMSAVLAPVQRAIAQALGSTLDDVGIGAAGSLSPRGTEGIGPRGPTIGSRPTPALGTRQTPSLGTSLPYLAPTLPTLGARAIDPTSLQDGLGVVAERAVPRDRVVARLPQSLAGGPGSLLAATMPFRALDAAHRQLSSSQRHGAADYARTAAHAEAPGIMMGAALPYGALEAAQRQLAASQRQAAEGSAGRSTAAFGLAVAPGQVSAGPAGQASAGGALLSSAGQPTPDSLGQATVINPLAVPLGQMTAGSIGRAAANRGLTASQRRAARRSAGSTTSADVPSGGLGSSEQAAAALAASVGGVASRRALRAFPTANATDSSGSATGTSAWPGLSPRQAALRQIAGSAGQPLAPVVRRMMEMALGATFADVRIHTGSAAGGAAQALGAQAFTMGRDIYFAPGKFEPGAAPGIALLAHELTHTRQGAAIPLRKAAPGAPALAEADAEPEHLEAQARGSEAAVLRAFSGPPPMPVLSRMVASNYDALSDDVGSGAGGAWSPFAARPALSGGSGGALVEGMASYATRSGRLGGGAQVQRQSVGTGLSGTIPSIAGATAAGGSAAQSPSAAQAASGIVPAVSTRIVPSASQSGISAAPLVGGAGDSSPIGDSGTGTTVQRRTRRSADQAARVGSGPEGSIEGAGPVGSAVLQSRAAAAIGTSIQRFTMPGTLLGDLARRHEAQASPGAVPLSSIFRADSESGPASVQRRAFGGAGTSFTFGASPSGLAALAGGAAFRASASTQPAWAIGSATPPAMQRTELSGSRGSGGSTTPPTVQRTEPSGGSAGSVSAAIGFSPSASITDGNSSATVGRSTGALDSAGTPSAGETAMAASGGNTAGMSAQYGITGGTAAQTPDTSWTGGQGAPLSADRGTIPILQRLAAGGFQGENTPTNADDLSTPILARMNTAEHAALSFGGAPSGESWGTPQSLSLGGQGAGWAGAAGGMLHQVQRLTARQTAFPVFSGAAAAPFGASGTSMNINQGSASPIGIQAGSSYGVPDHSLGIAGDSSASAGQAAVQRTVGNAGGIGSSLTGALQRASIAGNGGESAGSAAVQRTAINAGGMGSSFVGAMQRTGVDAGPSGFANLGAVQRSGTQWAGTPSSLMSLSGHGHGLAAMTGGLAARTLGPAAVQRMAARGVTPYNAAYIPSIPSSGASFSPVGSLPLGTGVSAQPAARAATGAGDFARTTMLQRFAAGELGGSALGAALLERMSGTGDAGRRSGSADTLAGGTVGMAGIVGGVGARIQRMAGSGSIGTYAGAASTPDLSSPSGSFARDGGGVGSRGEGSASLGASLGSHGTALGVGGSHDFGAGSVLAGLPAVQRVEPATWTVGGSQALVGEGYGLAAMSGGLAARALQAGGSAGTSSVQRWAGQSSTTGTELGNGLGSIPASRYWGGVGGSAGTSGFGPAWSATLPLQRFATSAAIGQAAVGAAQRRASTPVLLGGGAAANGELAGAPSTVFVSRMWSGQPVGGAMTDDTAPGAAGPNGSPVPALSGMTQRAEGTSAMLVFSGLTGDETAAPSARGGAAPTLPVNRAMAMPAGTPAPAASASSVLVQRATPSLAPAAAGETTLAGRSLVVPPPVQRAVTVDEISSSGTDTSSSSASGSSAADQGTGLPKDMETLIDTVIKRLKRQLTLDHERAGGFHTSLRR
jgi:hypothetical protein